MVISRPDRRQKRLWCHIIKNIELHGGQIIDYNSNRGITYTYNAYGDVAEQDGAIFDYDDASGQVTKKTTKLTKHKDVVKHYTYDSNNNRKEMRVGNKVIVCRYNKNDELIRMDTLSTDTEED